MVSHPQQWSKLQAAFDTQRLSQGMLFVGPMHTGLNHFAMQIAQFIFCKRKNNNLPCLICPNCSMVAAFEHPDLQWIKPEKKDGAIKVDQIRELQTLVYLTPQNSAYRLIIIQDADKMNASAANALLKILEEPAPHTLFILIAQQLNTLLPTILSRCQIIPFTDSDENTSSNLLMLGEKYPADSTRFLISQHSEEILNQLIALMEKKQHPCFLAIEWAQYTLSDLTWFLYLVYAQLQYHWIQEREVTGGGASQLEHLAKLVNPMLIFNQIDKLNAIIRKLNQNISINPILAVEDLLFSLLSGF